MRKGMRILQRLLILLIAVAVGGGVYTYLAPMMSAETVISYAEYIVHRGSIATEKSFSATISISSSETHQNTSQATSIREIYVKNGQTVQVGDKLMLLNNGELLRAGLDGVVTEMRFDTTDWLWNNVQLIQISDLTNLKVTLSVDEYDVRNVTAGQKCIVSIIPLGLDFETKIAHVDRVSASSGQVAHYNASAELVVPSNVLPGMTASVTIPSETVEDVLLLDMAALAFDEDKQPYVLRKEGEDYIRVPVTTGLSDGMQVKITSGLAEGDQVWATAGTETVESKFSLAELYKKVVGEKVVINDMTGGNDRNNRMTPTGTQSQNASQRMSETPISSGAPGGRSLNTAPGASGQPTETPAPAEESSEGEAAATPAPDKNDEEGEETP